MPTVALQWAWVSWLCSPTLTLKQRVRSVFGMHECKHKFAFAHSKHLNVCFCCSHSSSIQLRRLTMLPCMLLLHLFWLVDAKLFIDSCHACALFWFSMCAVRCDLVFVVRDAELSLLFIFRFGVFFILVAVVAR